MDIKKFLIGTIAGGIAFFLLGFIIYGILLMPFFTAHAGSAVGVNRTTDMVWWALILGNFTSAALLSYIFVKWVNVNSFGSGLNTGAIIGFLMTLGYDMTQYGTTNIIDLTGAVTDVVAGTVMVALAGGVIGIFVGFGRKS